MLFQAPAHADAPRSQHIPLDSQRLPSRPVVSYLGEGRNEGTSASRSSTMSKRQWRYSGSKNGPGGCEDSWVACKRNRRARPKVRTLLSSTPCARASERADAPRSSPQTHRSSPSPTRLPSPVNAPRPSKPHCTSRHTRPRASSSLTNPPTSGTPSTRATPIEGSKYLGRSSSSSTPPLAKRRGQAPSNWRAEVLDCGYIRPRRCSAYRRQISACRTM